MVTLLLTLVLLQEPDVRTIARGEAVEEKDHLVRGKHTIFDYYADWCAPCRLLDRQLRKLAAENPKIAIRRIDIIDFNSAAAQKAVEEFGMTGIPFVRVYGPDGRLKGQVVGADVEKIRDLVTR